MPIMQGFPVKCKFSDIKRLENHRRSSGAETGWVQMNLMWVKEEMDRPDVASTTCLRAGKSAADRDGSPVKPERQKKLKTLSGKQPWQTNISASPLVSPDHSSCKSSSSQNRLFLNNKMGFCKLRSVFNYPHNPQQMLGCHRYRPGILLDPQHGSAVWPGFTFPDVLSGSNHAIVFNRV